MASQTEVIDCGLKSEIESACRRDERCCVFIEPAAGMAWPTPDWWNPDQNPVRCEIIKPVNSPELPVCTVVEE